MTNLGCFKDKEKLIRELLSPRHFYAIFFLMLLIFNMVGILNLVNFFNLKSKLACFRHNTEKMVYFLLLDRKRRRPAHEDETEVLFLNFGIMIVWKLVLI